VEPTPSPSPTPSITLTDPLQISEVGAYKGRLASIATADNGALIVVYAQENGPTVWDLMGDTHRARDIFATRSTDGGLTWSTPSNISQLANLSSAMVDDDGTPTTPPVPYYGDCGKPTIMVNGTSVIVIFESAYHDGGPQRAVFYPDSQVEVPYQVLWAVRSFDGGATWSVLEQVTDGTRDVSNEVARATAGAFAIAWQEDPRGLQPGEGEGPGDGGSGAKVSVGTDIWFAALKKTSFDGATPFPAPVRLTDNFTAMDGGFESGTVGASRPQIFMYSTTVGLVYEEMKSADGLAGKYVRYHTFNALTGPSSDPTAGIGNIVSDPTKNARRARIQAQGTTGPLGTRLLLMWREGVGNQGAPADFMARVGRVNPADPASTGMRPSDLIPALGPDPTTGIDNAPAFNLSSSAGIGADSETDPAENARAHRVIMQGDAIVTAFTWTPDGAAAATGTANFNLYIHRSLDGGTTWEGRRAITHLADATVTVEEPRLVKTSSPDSSMVYLAWGVQQNAPWSGAPGTPIDIMYTRSPDLGATIEPSFPLADGPNPQAECQMVLSEDGAYMYSIWMETLTGGDAVMFRSGH
jgi:hypothetical protein